MHAVFEKHKLNYSLGFGSAIGAIRHRGIIPWDDDLDVMIMEEEEELFLTNIRSELLNDKNIKIVNGTSNGYWDYKLVHISNEFPNCDVFVLRLDKSRKIYTLRNERHRLSSAHIFNQSAMHPTLTRFGHFQMRILTSNDYEYLSNEYGKYWRNIAFTNIWDHYSDVAMYKIAFQIPMSLMINSKMNDTN